MGISDPEVQRLRMPLTLTSLPAELILQIHLLAQSAALPLVCTHIHDVLATQATTSYKIGYIHQRLREDALTLKHVTRKIVRPQPQPQPHDAGHHVFLMRHHPIVLDYLHRVLRFHFTTLQIYQHFERELLGYMSRIAGIPGTAFSAPELAAYGWTDDAARDRKLVWIGVPLDDGPSAAGAGAVPSTLVDTRELSLAQLVNTRHLVLPKRLFARLVATPPLPRQSACATSPPNGTLHEAFDKIDYPLVAYLLTSGDGRRSNANCHKGYLLARAVLARHIPLIRLLLNHGASPAEKKHMSVMLAIGRNDLLAVRMLIEGGRPEEEEDFRQRTSAAATTAASTGTNKRPRKRKASAAIDSPDRAKRQKVEDRTAVTSQMLELATRQRCDPLVRYFMVRGAVPNLKTLKLLERSSGT